MREKGTELSGIFVYALFIYFLYMVIIVIVVLLQFVRLRRVSESIFVNHLWLVCVCWWWRFERKFASCFDPLQFSSVQIIKNENKIRRTVRQFRISSIVIVKMPKWARSPYFISMNGGTVHERQTTHLHADSNRNMYTIWHFVIQMNVIRIGDRDTDRFKWFVRLKWVEVAI